MEQVDEERDHQRRLERPVRAGEPPSGEDPAHSEPGEQGEREESAREAALRERLEVDRVRVAHELVAAVVVPPELERAGAEALDGLVVERAHRTSPDEVARAVEVGEPRRGVGADRVVGLVAELVPALRDRRVAGGGNRDQHQHHHGRQADPRRAARKPPAGVAACLPGERSRRGADDRGAHEREHHGAGAGIARGVRDLWLVVNHEHDQHRAHGRGRLVRERHPAVVAEHEHEQEGQRRADERGARVAEVDRGAADRHEGERDRPQRELARVRADHERRGQRSSS